MTELWAEADVLEAGQVHSSGVQMPVTGPGVNVQVHTSMPTPRRPPDFGRQADTGPSSAPRFGALGPGGVAAPMPGPNSVTGPTSAAGHLPIHVGNDPDVMVTPVPLQLRPGGSARGQLEATTTSAVSQTSLHASVHVAVEARVQAVPLPDSQPQLVNGQLEALGQRAAAVAVPASRNDGAREERAGIETQSQRND